MGEVVDARIKFYARARQVFLRNKQVIGYVKARRRLAQTFGAVQAAIILAPHAIGPLK